MMSGLFESSAELELEEDYGFDDALGAFSALIEHHQSHFHAGWKS
jgi:hypothetical protein